MLNDNLFFQNVSCQTEKKVPNGITYDVIRCILIITSLHLHKMGFVFITTR